MYSRQEVKWEKERGMGSGNVLKPGFELGTPVTQQHYISHTAHGADNYSQFLIKNIRTLSYGETTDLSLMTCWTYITLQLEL